MRAMNAANGAARVFSSVWLPGRTSGMKFSSAAITRLMCLLNRPCLRDFSVWAKRSAASASSPNRYWYWLDDSRRLVRDDCPLRPGMSFMACRSESGMARTPSGSRGRALSSVSGLVSCLRWVVSRMRSIDLRSSSADWARLCFWCGVTLGACRPCLDF